MQVQAVVRHTLARIDIDKVECRASETECHHEHERERFGGALPPQEGRAVDGPTDKGIGMTG